MNVPLIQEPPEEAKRKFQLYKAALMKNAFEEFRIAKAAYQKMAQGKPLLDLADAFREVPIDAKGRPGLAIARADMKEVEVNPHNGRFQFDTGWSWRIPQYRARYHRISVPSPVSSFQGGMGYAMVPMIPPDCIPKIKIENFHILWEVEAWADDPQTIRPDRDPLLLRHLAGTLYAVEAAWDLTDLERAIMAGIRRTA